MTSCTELPHFTPLATATHEKLTLPPLKYIFAATKDILRIILREY